MLRLRKLWPTWTSSSVTMSLLSFASSSFTDNALGVHDRLGVWRKGWRKGWVGLKDPEPVDMCEPVLVDRACGVLRVTCEKLTSDADGVPKSCMPNPARAPFSEVDLDRSSRP